MFRLIYRFLSVMFKLGVRFAYLSGNKYWEKLTSKIENKNNKKAFIEKKFENSVAFCKINSIHNLQFLAKIINNSSGLYEKCLMLVFPSKWLHKTHFCFFFANFMFKTKNFPAADIFFAVRVNFLSWKNIHFIVPNVYLP